MTEQLGKWWYNFQRLGEEERLIYMGNPHFLSTLCLK